MSFDNFFLTTLEQENESKGKKENHKSRGLVISNRFIPFVILQNADRKRDQKFIYSKKATKFYKISILFLSYVVPIKSKEEISQNLVCFSEPRTLYRVSHR